MALELVKTPPLKDLQAMHDRYMLALGLDENQDGETVAALLEDMLRENPTNWQERAEGLLEETLKILKEKSLKDAMFFLGDRINIRDMEHRQANAESPALLAQRLELKAAIQAASRQDWNPEERAIAGSFGQESVPPWYYEWKEAS